MTTWTVITSILAIDCVIMTIIIIIISLNHFMQYSLSLFLYHRSIPLIELSLRSSLSPLSLFLLFPLSSSCLLLPFPSHTRFYQPLCLLSLFSLHANRDSTSGFPGIPSAAILFSHVTCIFLLRVFLSRYLLPQIVPARTRTLSYF